MLGLKPPPAKKTLDYPRLRLSSIAYFQGPSFKPHDHIVAPCSSNQTYNFAQEERALNAIRSLRADRDAANQRDRDIERGRKDQHEQQAQKEQHALPAAAELKVHVVAVEPVLSPAQIGTLDKFMAFTGVPDRARALELNQCVDWDLNVAIARFLDSGDVQKAIEFSKRAKTVHETAIETAKLTLAFPDGSSTIGQFNPTDSLWAVFYHVQESGKVQPVGRMISFHTDTQQVLTDAEFDQTLKSIGLAGNASLRIVLA